MDTNMERSQQITELINKGLSLTDICLELKISRRTLNKYEKKLGIKAKRDKFKWDKEKLLYLEENISGKTFKELALHFNTTEYSVRNICYRNNIYRPEKIKSEGYLSTPEIINLLHKDGIKWVTGAILTNLSKKGLINKTKLTSITNIDKNTRVRLWKKQLSEYAHNYFSYEDYEYLSKELKGYSPVVNLRKKYKLPKSWFQKDKFLGKHTKKLGGNASLLLINKEGEKFVINLMENYLPLTKFAEKCFYSKMNIWYLIKNKKLTSIKFRNTHWLNKAFLEKIHTMNKF